MRSGFYRVKVPRSHKWKIAFWNDETSRWHYAAVGKEMSQVGGACLRNEDIPIVELKTK